MITMTPALQAALAEARLYALDKNIGCVASSAIALAILHGDDSFLAVFNGEIGGLQKIQRDMERAAAAQPFVPVVDQSLPLTKGAARLLSFAEYYAYTCYGTREVDSIHLFLAVFSYYNEVQEVLSRNGWIFDNFVVGVSVLVNVPASVKQLVYPFKMPDPKPLSFLEKLLLNRTARARELSELMYSLMEFGEYEKCMQVNDMVASLVGDIPSFVTQYNWIKMFCLGKLRRFPEAVALGETAPADNDAMRMNLANAYIEIGRFGDAVALLTQITTRSELTCNMLGFAYASAGDYLQAVLAFDEGIIFNPQYAYLYNNKGYALMKLGDLAEARRLILQSLTLDKGNAYAYRNLALLCLEEGNKTDAKANVEKALFYKYREQYGNDIDEIMERADQV